MVEEYNALNGRMIATKTDYEFQQIRDFVSTKENFILVFSDASFELGSGRSACGMIMVSETGVLLGYRSIALGILHSALEAEIIAIKLGLDEVRKFGAKRVGLFQIAWRRSRQFVRQKKIWCWGGYTLNIIRDELKEFKHSIMKHIGRDYNSAVHLLAKLAGSPTDISDWVGNKVIDWVQDLRYHFDV